MKKTSVFAGMLASVLLLILVTACATSPESGLNETAAKELFAPREGTFHGSGWGVVELQKDGDTFSGTYTDTWAADKGTLELFIEGSQWKGVWAEPAIDRGGEIYQVDVSENGKTITGLYSVTRAGGYSTFTDEPFRWEYSE